MTIRNFEHHTPAIATNAYIDETAVVIGEVTIGEQSSVWPMCVVRGDVNAIHIGARSNIQDASVLHVTHAPNEYSEQSGIKQTGYPLTIGDEVTVGHKAMLHACEIHDRVLIGMAAIVMDGVVIESDTIIGAGSLVPPHKRLESGYLWMGSPATKARPLSDKEKSMLKYSAAHYVRLIERTQKSLNDHEE